MAILNQYGKEIKELDNSKKPISTSKNNKFGSVYSYNQSDQAYNFVSPVTLRSILESANNGNCTDQASMFNYIIDNDDILPSVIQQRKLAVLGKQWDIIGGSKIKNEKIKEVLVNINGQSRNGILGAIDFYNLKKHLLDAVSFGYAGALIRWRFGGAGIETFIPVAHENWYFDYMYNRYIRSIDGNNTLVDDSNKEQVVFHSHYIKHGLPCSGGLLRPASWMYFKKVNITRYQMRSFEKFGIPSIIAKISNQDFNNDDVFNKILSMLENWGSDGVGVVTQESDIEFPTSQQQTGLSFKEVIDSINDGYKILYLGQLASSGEAGGFSTGQIQGTTKDELIIADCVNLDETITQEIIAPLEYHMFGTSECSHKTKYEKAENIETVLKTIDGINKIQDVEFENIEEYIEENTGIPVKKKIKEEPKINVAEEIISPTPTEHEQVNEQQETLPANPLDLLAQQFTDITHKKHKAFQDIDINEWYKYTISNLINNSLVSDEVKSKAMGGLEVSSSYENAIRLINNVLTSQQLAKNTSDEDRTNISVLRNELLKLLDKKDEVKNQIEQLKKREEEKKVEQEQEVEENKIEAITEPEMPSLKKNGEPIGSLEQRAINLYTENISLANDAYNSLINGEKISEDELNLIKEFIPEKYEEASARVIDIEKNIDNYKEPQIGESLYFNPNFKFAGYEDGKEKSYETEIWTDGNSVSIGRPVIVTDEEKKKSDDAIKEIESKRSTSFEKKMSREQRKVDEILDNIDSIPQSINKNINARPLYFNKLGDGKKEYENLINNITLNVANEFDDKPENITWTDIFDSNTYSNLDDDDKNRIKASSLMQQYGINLNKTNLEEYDNAVLDFFITGGKKGLAKLQRGDIKSKLDTIAFDAIAEKDDKMIDEVIVLRNELNNLENQNPIKGDNFVSNSVLGATEMLPALGKGAIQGVVAPGVGSAQYFYRLGTGDMYASMIEDGVDKDLSKIASVVGGIPYAALEYAQFNRLTRIADRVIPQSGIKDVTKNAVIGAIKKHIIPFGTDLFNNITQEGLQKIVSDVTSDSIKSVDNHINDNEDLEKLGIKKILINGLNEAKDAIGPMVVLQLLGVGGNIASKNPTRKLNSKISEDKISESLDANKEFIYSIINEINLNKSEQEANNIKENKEIEKVEEKIKNDPEKQISQDEKSKDIEESGYVIDSDNYFYDPIFANIKPEEIINKRPGIDIVLDGNVITEETLNNLKEKIEDIKKIEFDQVSLDTENAIKRILNGQFIKNSDVKYVDGDVKLTKKQRELANKLKNDIENPLSKYQDAIDNEVQDAIISGGENPKAILDEAMSRYLIEIVDELNNIRKERGLSKIDSVIEKDDGTILDITQLPVDDLLNFVKNEKYKLLRRSEQNLIDKISTENLMSLKDEAVNNIIKYIEDLEKKSNQEISESGKNALKIKNNNEKIEDIYNEKETLEKQKNTEIEEKIKNMLNLFGVKGKYRKLFAPFRHMATYMDGFDNGLMTSIVNDFDRNEDIALKMLDESTIEKDKIVSKVKDFDKKMKQKSTIFNSLGEEVEVTVPQKIYLYLLSLNDKSIEHMLKDGIVLDPKKGKDIMYFSEDSVQKLQDDIESNRDYRIIADGIYNIYNNIFKKYLNHISRTVDGFRIANEDNYIGMLTLNDKQIMDDPNKLLENKTNYFDYMVDTIPSLRKRVEGAKYPLLIDDIFKVLANSQRNYSDYVKYNKVQKRLKGILDNQNNTLLKPRNEVDSDMNIVFEKILKNIKDENQKTKAREDFESLKENLEQSYELKEKYNIPEEFNFRRTYFLAKNISKADLELFNNIKKSMDNIYNEYPELKPKQINALKDALVNKFGKSGEEYYKMLENLSNDIANPLDVDDIGKFAMKAERAIRDEIIRWNLEISLVQAVSYLTAKSELPLDSWYVGLKAINGLPSKEFMGVYSPLFKDRFKNQNAMIFSEELNPQSTKYSKAAMKTMVEGDYLAIAKIWVAVEDMISKKYPDIPYRSAQFNNMVAREAEKITRNTQPTFSIIDRPEISRNRSPYVRMFTRWNTQKSTTYGQVIKNNRLMWDEIKKITTDEPVNVDNIKTGLMNYAVMRGAVPALVAAIKELSWATKLKLFALLGIETPKDEEDDSWILPFVSRFFSNIIGDSGLGISKAGEIIDIISSQYGKTNAFNTTFGQGVNKSIDIIKEVIWIANDIYNDKRIRQDKLGFKKGTPSWIPRLMNIAKRSKSSVLFGGGSGASNALYWPVVAGTKTLLDEIDEDFRKEALEEAKKELKTEDNKTELSDISNTKNIYSFASQEATEKANQIFTIQDYISGLKKKMEELKNDITPEVEQEPIVIDGRGTIFKVEGSEKRKLAIDKLIKELTETLKISDETAAIIINRASDFIERKSYIKVQKLK